MHAGNAKDGAVLKGRWLPLLFVLFNLAAAAGLAAAALTFWFYLPRSPAVALSEPLPVVAESNRAATPAAAPDLVVPPGDDGGDELGEPPPRGRGAEFAWPASAALLAAALEHFTALGDPRACLYLAAVAAPPDFPEGAKLDYARKFQGAAAAEFLGRHLVEFGVEPPADGAALIREVRGQPFAARLAAINNFHIGQRAAGVPEAVNAVMTQLLAAAIADDFLNIYLRQFPADGGMRGLLSPAAAASFAANIPLESRRRVMEFYLAGRLASLVERWGGAEPDVRRWIFANGVTDRNHLAALRIATRPGAERLPPADYAALSPLHRHALAESARRAAAAEFESFLAPIPFWRGELKAAAADGTAFVAAARGDRHWFELLYQGGYDEALEWAERCHAALLDQPMPESVRSRLLATLEAERTLWLQHVHPAKWREIRARAGEGRGVDVQRVYWEAVKEALPEWRRDSTQKVLLALCMVNRGVDYNAFVHIDSSEPMVKRFFPQAEISAQPPER